MEANGSKSYCINGNLHREGGPAVVREDGFTAYYKNDKLHREDGPAIEWNGYAEWWINGIRLR